MKPARKRSYIHCGMIAILLSATAFSFVNVSSAQAERRTLLEQWFPKARIVNRERKPLFRMFDRKKKAFIEPQQQKKVRKAAPVKKITGPRYYAYKAEALKVLKLSPVLAAIKALEEEEVPTNALLGEDDFGKPSELAADGRIDPVQTGSVVAEQPYLTVEGIDGLSLEAEAGIAKAVTDYYAANPKYLWVTPEMKPNAKARGLIRYMEQAGKYGLEAEDYAIGTNPDDTGMRFDERQAAKFEFMLSIAAVRFAADADKGRVNPNGISGYHDFPEWSRDYEGYMEKLAAANVPVLTLSKMQPSHPRFAALVKELAELEGSDLEAAPEPVKAGTFIRPGQTHPELPNVVAGIAWKASAEFKARHAAVFSQDPSGTLYDEATTEMLRDFQKENGLKPDGIIGKNTLRALTVVSDKAKAEKVRLAMERLRWHPEHFGRRHVFINQPAYQASYVMDNEDKLSMRVIVGKPANQTSFFHDTIELVEFNPYWNVPRSILVNEMLSSVRRNPGYFEARGYEVVSHGGRTVSGHSVDWWSESASKKYYVRQKPGAKNALGELKILFPNKHNIYMHDTPSRGLFKRSERALSHGCVRLSDPRAMAAVVLGTNKNKVASYISGGKNKAVKLDRKIPVYVAYFTAWPDANGKVGYYPDIYGRDKHLEKAIESTEKLRKQTLASG